MNWHKNLPNCFCSRSFFMGTTVNLYAVADEFSASDDWL
jgi:hypothetical protein